MHISAQVLVIYMEGKPSPSPRHLPAAYSASSFGAALPMVRKGSRSTPKPIFTVCRLASGFPLSLWPGRPQHEDCVTTI